MFVVKRLFCQMRQFPKSRQCLAGCRYQTISQMLHLPDSTRKSIEGGVGQQFEMIIFQSDFSEKTCSWSFELLPAKARWVGVPGSKSRKP